VRLLPHVAGVLRNATSAASLFCFLQNVNIELLALNIEQYR
jgi:hypothetical protein